MQLRKRCRCCGSIAYCQEINNRWVCDACLYEYEQEKRAVFLDPIDSED